jgi:hypothetical protein
MALPSKGDLLGDRAELVVRVGETISDHERLEIDLGYSRDWGKVKCRVVLVDRLFVSDVPSYKRTLAMLGIYVPA